MNHDLLVLDPSFRAAVVFVSSSSAKARRTESKPHPLAADWSSQTVGASVFVGGCGAINGGIIFSASFDEVTYALKPRSTELFAIELTQI